ncbi:MAG TPA: thiolase family protein [Saprospiraceae bacterium]|nr:thiolase family protein [Saprospiraceae bacterium]
MKKVFIVDAVRTPIGSFGGVLSSLSAVDLGAMVIRAIIERQPVTPDSIDEIFMGNVCQANLGQAPARQAALNSGLPPKVPCTTVNKVCSSGLKSVMFGAQSIMLSQADIIIAGGMESMSNIPYYVTQARWGYKYGGGELVDGLERDGLMDAYDRQAMGVFADRTATHYHISREEQDEYAIQSYRRSAASSQEGKFSSEIIPVRIPQRKGDVLLVEEDEEYKKVFFDKIPSLRPAFSLDGTVTAANASTINDGASALLLASEKAIKEYGLHPLAEIIGFSDAAREPQWFTTAPVLAAPRAIERAGLKINDIDIFEVNEAFAVVPLAFGRELNVSTDRMNIHGGAVSLGHPLGASGARILTTLVHALHFQGRETGCATLCNGGGGASALVIKKV